MKVTKSQLKELIRHAIVQEIKIPFSSSHIKQLKRAFKDMKGTLPDNNPLVQQIVTLLKKTDKKVLKQIANADIKYLSDKAKDILGEGVNSSLVKKMIKAVNKGEDVVVYDKKGKKYSLQSGDNKAVAVTDYLGSEKTYQTLPMSKVKKIVIEGKLTSEQKLRESIREIIKEQLNEVKFKKVILPNDMKTKVKVSKMIKQLKLKIDKDYDVKALKARGGDQVISILPKHYNKFIELAMKNKLNPRG